jgi:hypothetical protein
LEITPAGGRSLNERLDTEAEAWRPKPGAKVIGEVIDVDTRTTEFGVYPMITIRTDGGDEIAVHGFHTVLRNELAKRPPRLGERLGIKYLGKHDKGYENYRVVFEQATPPDWNRIAVEAVANVVGEGVEEPVTPATAGNDIPF